MKKLLIIACASLFVSSPAFAQKSILPSQNDILTKIVDDANAAKADADQNKDVIASTCYTAIATVASAKLNAAQVQGGGALTAFQKVRDVTRLNASPVGTELIVGCAPLAQDAKVNLVQFFANIGGAVLLKGIIPLP